MAATFWDTSALLALVFDEPHSASASEALEATTEFHAWDWLTVEAKASLTRRRASDHQRNHLAGLLEFFLWQSILPDKIPDLCEFNEANRLRAADAGHLFCYHRARTQIADLYLVTFDRKMMRAAQSSGYTLWKNVA